MKKSAISLVLMAAPAIAYAQQWVVVSSTEKSTTYVDVSSIKTIGDLKRAWELADFKAKTPNGILSFRAYNEYNCTEGKSRTLELSAFKEGMAKGSSDTVADSPGKWYFSPPGSAVDAITSFVCSK